MKVGLTLQAERHVEAIDAWWQQNRELARDLFLEELALALQSLA